MIREVVKNGYYIGSCLADVEKLWKEPTLEEKKKLFLSALLGHTGHPKVPLNVVLSTCTAQHSPPTPTTTSTGESIPPWIHLFTVQTVFSTEAPWCFFNFIFVKIIIWSQVKNNVSSMAVGGPIGACLNMDSNTDGLASMMFLLYHHSFSVERCKSWFV